MPYRYTATGTIEFAERHVEAACAILRRKAVIHERHGNSVSIEHQEKSLTPSGFKAEEAFESMARYVERPQALHIYNELVGEFDLGFVDGRTRTDESIHVWGTSERVPTPDEIVGELRARGLAAIVKTPKRKGTRRTRNYEIAPGSGGPHIFVTVKRRFWDTFSLLSVPEVFEPLCRKYHLSPDDLRARLRGATFGIEVRKPALRNASSDLLYDSTLEVIEDLTDGIRTELGS